MSGDVERVHRWSGWPGAWCLDCGAEDPYEVALADGRIETDGEELWFIDPEEAAKCKAALICPEPGSNRHNPYLSTHPDERNRHGD